MLIEYNYDFLTTYKMLKNEEDSNLCYQIQLLQALNMQKYDDYIMQENIKKIYYFMRENNELKNIYKFLSKKNTQFEIIKEIILNDKTNNESPQDILNLFFFQLLFSYDYFYLMHKCMTKYLNNLLKNENNKESLQESLQESLYFEELKEFIINND